MVHLSHHRHRLGLHRGPDGERGAILVIGAVFLTVMLALAALGVDIANARVQKRSAQNSADAAALAAARDLPSTSTAIATAKDYVARNFGPVTWAGCVDADHLSAMPDPGNQCISFDSKATKVRVRIPTKDVNTFFGAAIGRRTLAVSAAAVAGAIISKSARIVPAAVSGIQGTGLVCVEQSGNNTACATREKGQFGSLSSPRLNWYFPTSNTGPTTLAINYAMNLDHDITSYASSDPRICDGSLLTPCTTTNGTTTASANHILTSTGNDIPPVTEGFVTGFTASTSDAGDLTFCGRLQRPDYTASNAADTKPGNCNSPGAPTISVLGKTINGRHVYHWLDDDAKQLFYPEVWALGYAETDQRLAVGQALFTNGDKRLDCFLAGYRWDPVTKTETLPNCQSVGLTYPGQATPYAHSAKDTFTTAAYSNNNGDVNWASNWTETGDDGTPGAGTITVNAQKLRIGTSNATLNRAIQRTVNMSDPTTGQLATSATVSMVSDGSNANRGIVTLSASKDGTNWTAIGSGKPSTPTTVTFDATAYISTATRFRFQVTGTGGGSEYLTIDDFTVTFSGSIPNGTPTQMAPIFREGMQDDPRWGVIPLVDSWGSSTVAKPIQGFKGFYASTCYTSNSKVQAFDAWVFDPALTLQDPNSQTFTFGFSPTQLVRLVK